MSELRVVGGHREQFHSLVVQCLNGRMDGILRQVGGVGTRETNCRLRAGRRFGIVKRVLESCSPVKFRISFDPL